MRVFLNPRCDYGKGEMKWKKLEPELRLRGLSFEVEELSSLQKLIQRIEQLSKRGERVFVAAGGDGTLHCLVNALMNSRMDVSEVTVGAIGLGSSNDFHKPFRREEFWQGIPVKLDWREPLLRDLIRVRLQNGRGAVSQRICLINASIGITAQANAVYNSRLPFLRFIQKISIEGAILFAALKTILSFHNIPCTISRSDGRMHALPLTNLGVIKSPHFAGGLCYDIPLAPNDGFLGINLCADMNKSETLLTLFNLYRQRFQGRPKTFSWLTQSLSVKSRQPFAVEMDGEVAWASRVEFEILPRSIRCCQ